jgi:hypothetical protein
MPLASPPGRPDVVYGFGRIDASGRVADRVTIAALGWRCGVRLTLTANAGVLIARHDPGGLVTVPARPCIVIPAALRRRWVLWLRRVSAVVDHAAVPLIEGTRAAARAGHMPGGSRRNLDWVLPHTDAGAVGEDDLLLLADAQTSGGLLVAGELPGTPVIGELIPRRDSVLIIR